MIKQGEKFYTRQSKNTKTGLVQCGHQAAGGDRYVDDVALCLDEENGTETER